MMAKCLSVFLFDNLLLLGSISACRVSVGW